MLTEKETQTGVEEEALSGPQGASGRVREAAGAKAERGEEQAPRGTQTKAQCFFTRIQIIDSDGASGGRFTSSVNQLNLQMYLHVNKKSFNYLYSLLSYQFKP